MSVDILSFKTRDTNIKVRYGPNREYSGSGYGGITKILSPRTIRVGEEDGFPIGLTS